MIDIKKILFTFLRDKVSNLYIYIIFFYANIIQKDYILLFKAKEGKAILR